jgi:hypothetical protein
MVTNFVEQRSSRATRNLLIVGVLLLAAIVTALALSSRYFYNVVSGPFGVENNVLAGLTDVRNLQQYFVTVNGEDAADTGIDEVVTHSRNNGSSTSETLAAHYMVVVVGERLMVVRSASDDETVTQFIGTLQPVPADVQHEVIDSVLQDFPDLKGTFLPFMMNVEDIRPSGRIELLLGVALLLLAVWNLIRNIRRQINPEAQPIYKALSAYGPVQGIVGAIDAEVAGPGCVQVGKAIITPHWVLHAKPFGLDVVRLDDLIWMYQKVTVQRTYFIKTGETYTALFWTRQGKAIEIAGKQPEITSMLAQVAHHAPWAMRGFTKDRDKAWRTDRQRVIQTVMNIQQSYKTQDAVGHTTPISTEAEGV